MSIITGLAVLSVGILIGVVISRWIVFQNGRASQMARQLDEVHAEYAAYQEKVDQHFRTTADLLNALSSNYGAIHQHLALGIQTLSQRNIGHVNDKHTVPGQRPTHSVEALDYSARHASGPEDIPTAVLDQPKDYAPKTAGDPGLLSQQYSQSGKNNAKEN